MVVEVEVEVQAHLLEQVVEQEQMQLGMVAEVEVEDRYLPQQGLAAMAAMAHPES
jgi:hypothetical protein